MDNFEYHLNFYITQFRRMFFRLAVIYTIIIVCLIFVFVQLSSIKEPVYYASSESGLLRKLEPYTKKDIARFVKNMNNKTN